MINIFDTAKLAYRDSVHDLTVMSATMGTLVKQNGGQFDTRYILERFDILLQYSLLQIAVADSKLISNELAFIKELAEHGDFCDYLKSIGYSNASWASIYNTDQSMIREILEQSREDMIKMSTDYIMLFSAFDAASEYDYLADLSRNVAIIISATCQADGIAQSSELDNGCLILNVIEAIRAQINKFN